MKTAFAGFRHDHVFVLYEQVSKHPDFEIVGAFEENEESKTKAISKGVAFTYDSYEELLNDNSVQTVVVGFCYGDRGRAVIDALKHGKHVIVDKPLCTKLEELDEIERLSKQNSLVVSCMYTMRFERKINAVKQLLESGELGEINNVYFGGQHPLQYGRRPSWYFEKGKHGGVINDIAIHGIDLISYLLSDSVKTVNGARQWNKYAQDEPEFLDSAQFMLTTQKGTGVIADVSYSVPNGVEFALPYYWQFYLWGTKGVISFALNEPTSTYYIAGDKEPKILVEEPVKTDYLTDFLRVVEGKDDVALSVFDTLNSTRSTLLIQDKANRA
ncbi:MAG: Gfo/Idh/MocA family oxidoreductase [Clostridiales bacterium]|nr:Gfo/Idh/MocA family oxidoreductase [Clostridiales bacterium]